MKPKVIHYAGALSWLDKKGAHSSVFAGWAACCSGDRATAIRREGNNTYEPAEVTCKTCLQRLEAARVFETSGTAPATPLERAEAYIAALEGYIEGLGTCIVCSCLLFPNKVPPHCEDTCHPDPDQEIDWEAKAYLDEPVKQLRAKHGRAP